ncbi:MAG: PilZ domain-containing protein [Acidobacteriota bacterium]
MPDQDASVVKENAIDKKNPCQVTFFLDEKVLKGTSLHFNERGLLVTCQQPAPLNRKLKLILQFPGFKNPIELQGEVVWTNVHGTPDSLTPKGMGVKFLNPDRDIERLLAELAGHYETFGSMYSCYYT